MAKRVIIIHGWNGRPQGGWKPWLKKKLEGKGFEVYVPAMPNPSMPNMGEWVDRIIREIGRPDKDCILVGHSLGCIAILRYLEGLGKDESVGGAVLVAGFSDNLGMFLFNSFFSSPLDWKGIKSHCNKFVAIHSDNDRYVPLRHGDIFRRELRAKLVVKKGMGHFSGDEGCTELPVALDAVLGIAAEN
ncbi:MAG: alpha/beta fold hydrolase [Candidatus Micrarchaeota archaeon]